MTAPWQRTFAAFAGPGIAHPSNALRVTDGEAATLLADMAGRPWLPAAHVGSGRHRGYAIRHTPDQDITALFCEEAIVGFYAGSYLWIDRHHRGRGLSTPLILAAAGVRDGRVLPPGVVVQGFSVAGLAAHRAAHHHAVVTAIARGQAVPEAVRAELAAAETATAR